MRKLFFVLILLCVGYEFIAQNIGFQWAKNMGVGYDNHIESKSISADIHGNLFTMGTYNGSPDLDPGTGVYNLPSSIGHATYLQKLDAQGNFKWSKVIKGTSDAEGMSMKLDYLGNIYITGYHDGTSTDFDPGPGTYNLSSSVAVKKAFLLKLDTAGNFVWVKGFGNSVYCEGRDLISDSNNLYLVGNFTGTVDFDAGPNTYALTGGNISSSACDIFISKLDLSGGFIWTKQISGPGMGSVSGLLDVDFSGNIYVGGLYGNWAYFGALSTTSGGLDDWFISKLDQSGNFMWVKEFNGDDRVNSLVVDNIGNLYSTGIYDRGSGVHPFITKWNTLGDSIWSKDVGGLHILLDHLQQNIYSTGSTVLAQDFDLDIGTCNINSSSGNNFILKLDTSSSFVWVKNMCGLLGSINEVSVDGTDNIYMTGKISLTSDFNPGVEVFNLNPNAGKIFVEKLGLCTAIPANAVNVTPIGNQTICAGKTSTLSMLASGTVSWFENDSSSTVIGIGSTLITPTLSAGTYTYYAQDNNSCTNSINKTAVSVTALSAAPITVNTGSICAGDSFVINASGATSYTFSSGSNTVTPTTTTSYTIQGTDLLGCIGYTTTTITVNLPIINFNNGTICSGESFTINASGADTYTLSDNIITLTNTNGTFLVNPITTTNYSITGTSNGCTSNVGSICSVYVIDTPTIIATATQSVLCLGSGTLLNAQGLMTTYYWWSTNESDNIIYVSPTVTTTYSITGFNGPMSQCTSTETITIQVDSNCQGVWPGDANSDGAANNLDILELGLHYNQIGLSRVITGNAWQYCASDNWAGTITNGKNLSHSDCNGDGIINSDDTLAIYNNYGSNHAFKPSNQLVTSLPFSIVPDKTVVEKGTWGSSSIYFGNENTPINNVNGVAFSVNFYTLSNIPQLLDSVSITYLTSFLNPTNSNLNFRKWDQQGFSYVNQGALHAATTHTNNVNANGYGKIAILHYKIKSNLITDEKLYFGMEGTAQSDATGNITLLPYSSGTNISVIGASVGVNELAGGSYLALYPNPAVNEVMVSSGSPMDKIEITSVTGQSLLKVGINAKNYSINTSELSNGIYFIRISSNGVQTACKKLMIQK